MFCWAAGTMTGRRYNTTEEKEGLMRRRIEDVKHCFTSGAITRSERRRCGGCLFPRGGFVASEITTRTLWKTD